MSKLGSRLKRFWAHDAVWNLAGTLSGRGAMAIFGIVVARHLGLTAFGLYNALLLFSMVFVAVIGGSLATSLTQAYATANFGEQRTAIAVARLLRRLLLLVSLLAVLLWVSAPLLTPMFGAIPDDGTNTLIRWSTPFIGFSLLANATMGLLAAQSRFRTLSLLQIGNGFALLLASVYLALMPFTLIAALYLLSICAALQALAGWLCVKNITLNPYRGTPTPSTALPTPHSLWQRFLPLALAACAVMPAHWLAVSWLMRQSQSGEVAIYGVALQWFQAAALLPTALANIALPEQTRLWQNSHAAGNLAPVQKHLWSATRRNLWLTLPIIGLCILGSPMLASLYKLPQAHASWVFALTFISTGLLAVQLPAANLLLAAGRFWAGLWMNFAWAVTYLLILFFLPKLFTSLLVQPALAAAGALLMAYAAHTLWTVFYAAKLE